MYLAIEMWQESGLSQHKFCDLEKISKSTFSYWLKKYRKEKKQVQAVSTRSDKAFIPVEISKTFQLSSSSDGPIEIDYPNGVRLRYSGGMEVQKLKSLILI